MVVHNRDSVSALRARRRAAGFVQVSIWVAERDRRRLNEFARFLLDEAAARGNPMPGDTILSWRAAWSAEERAAWSADETRLEDEDRDES